MPVNRERFLADFLELVRIPSPSGKEKEVARAVRAKLESMGLTVTEDNAGEKFGGEQGNLIVKVQGNLEGVPPIMFNAHLDTVVPCENVNPIVEGDKVRSDGGERFWALTTRLGFACCWSFCASSRKTASNTVRWR